MQPEPKHPTHSGRRHDEFAARRRFLASLAAAGAATALLDEPVLGAASPPPQATADACIVLWMAGGMASPETFDPKHYEPFEKGLPVEKVYSTFPSIPTAVDGIRISEGLEHVAEVMDRGTLIRSAVQPDLGNILHSRHQYHWHTGYVPPQTVAAPHIGAWMARLLGPRNPVMPAFINIGQQLEGNGESQELKAFTTAGFLGGEFGPFNLPYPDKAARAVKPPQGMTGDRFSSRYRALQRMLKHSPRSEYASEFHQESMMRSVENAHRLLASKERAAFDLEREDAGTREAYGPTRFGQGCLLARRLVEAGARYIEVTTEYVPFLHWDTHENGHATAARMKNEIDRPIARLVLDLEQRGLLDRTLVVLASEFSRDMLIEGAPGSSARDQSRARTDVLKEPKHYGLHRHFTQGSSVLMFGGGVKKGFLYGETADQRPCVATRNPVSIRDLHATIYKAMGVAADAHLEIERRPFYVTEDGKGRPVTDILA